MGDLSRLELLRPSHQRGASSKRYVFDYLSVLKQGGFAPNPLIYDGDSIRVLKADAPINADLITTASSNFAPSTITVKVLGEVASPGVGRNFIKCTSFTSDSCLRCGLSYPG